VRWNARSTKENCTTVGAPSFKCWLESADHEQQVPDNLS
jgi:hypothetical protein